MNSILHQIMTSEFGIELAGYPPNIVDIPGSQKIYAALKPARTHPGGIECLHSRVARTAIENIFINIPLILDLQESGLQIVYAYTSQGLTRFTGTNLGRLITDSEHRINAMRVFIGKKSEQAAIASAQELKAPLLKLGKRFQRTIFLIGHHPQNIVEQGRYQEDFRFVSLSRPRPNPL